MSSGKNCSNEHRSPLPLIDYGLTPYRRRTQHVSDMYDAGARLWTKNDLVDIERQLEQSASLDRFTLKCLDGTVVQVKNPFFGVRKPIWYGFVFVNECAPHIKVDSQETIRQVQRVLDTRPRKLRRSSGDAVLLILH